MAFFDHPDFDRHEQVVLGHDRASGLRALIAIHDTRRGPALGGCRTFAYPDDAAALRDVLRLSRSVTYKAAMGEVPYGGSKAVLIANPRHDKHAELFRALGRVIDGLGGRYITAEDAGTTVDDLQEVAAEQLRQAGIAYAPDYVINAGGLIDVSYERDALDDPQRVRAHIERIGPTLTQIFRQADRDGVPTHRVATRMAEERLEQRPSRVA